LGGKDFLQQLGRNALRERGGVSANAVIASVAKQSIAQRNERMDCFVASLLAMTTCNVTAWLFDN
jgi:hypothetical protein